MSNAYTWVESDPDAFRFTPGIDKKHWDDEELGYHRPAGHQLTGRLRMHMPEMEAEERIGFAHFPIARSFRETPELDIVI